MLYPLHPANGSPVGESKKDMQVYAEGRLQPNKYAQQYLSLYKYDFEEALACLAQGCLNDLSFLI